MQKCPFPLLCSDYSSTDRRIVAGESPARQIIRGQQSEHHTSGPPGCADVSQHPMNREPNTSNWITYCTRTPNGARVLCIETTGWVSLVLKCTNRTIQWQEKPQAHKHIQCTVESRFATVGFTTIHFYDPCPVGPSTPDLWCITVATQASFLYLVRF